MEEKSFEIIWTIIKVVFFLVCIIWFPETVVNYIDQNVKRCLRIYYQNARSIKGKLEQLRIEIFKKVYDVILLSETWLNATTYVNLAFEGYKVFRMDRNCDTSSCSKGGGVLIAVLNKYTSHRIDITEKHVEQLFVKVCFNGVPHIFGAVYIPPKSICKFYEKHCVTVQQLERENAGAKFYIAGDYNLSKIKWKSSSTGLTAEALKLVHRKSKKADILCGFFNLMGWEQKNNVLNYLDNCLDLVFSNDKTICVQKADETLLKNDQHHPPLMFDVTAKVEPHNVLKIQDILKALKGLSVIMSSS